MADTPEMAEPLYECTAVNSCPSRPAGQGNTDPIHNYMVRSAHAQMVWVPDVPAGKPLVCP